MLQLVLATEPAGGQARRWPADSSLTRAQVALFLQPYLERHELAPGVDVEEASDFLARMVLSTWAHRADGTSRTPRRSARLVRVELLAGIVPPASGGR